MKKSDIDPALFSMLRDTYNRMSNSACHGFKVFYTRMSNSACHGFKVFYTRMSNSACHGFKVFHARRRVPDFAWQIAAFPVS